ncbi:hypothetical protein ACFY2K_26285 [Kitasatospora sp. NPDC001309]|uniref:hypothetical protein n=1 Tax=Kitasatospora sp. NPDC001309 TaxID=3364013 RepID=UPI003676319D
MHYVNRKDHFGFIAFGADRKLKVPPIQAKRDLCSVKAVPIKKKVTIPGVAKAHSAIESAQSQRRAGKEFTRPCENKGPRVV